MTYLGTTSTNDAIDEIIKNDPKMNEEYLAFLRSYPKGLDEGYHDEDWVQSHYKDQYWLEAFTVDTYGFYWSGTQFDAIIVEVYDEMLEFDEGFYPYFSEGHFKKFAHLPHLFYHGTSSSLYTTIVKNGLTCENNIRNDKDSMNLVYLTISRLDAEKYAENAVRKFGGYPVKVYVSMPLEGLLPSIERTNKKYLFEEWVTDFVDPDDMIC